MCDSQWPRPELTAILTEVNESNSAELIGEVEKAADHCPACTVSAWRQSDPQTESEHQAWNGDITTTTGPLWMVYDYKTKSREYMTQKREDETNQYSF